MKRVCGLLALIMVLAALPLSSGPLSAQGPDFDIPGGHFYTQANGQGGAGGTGFGITDDGGVPFWTQFQELGGVDRLGFVSSRRFEYNGFPSQATQKYILQWQPGGLFFLNIFDELSAMGKDSYLETVRSIPRPATFNEAGQSFDQITAARLALLDANPDMKAVYMADPDPVRSHGLPTTNVVGVGDAFVIRNQRDAIQQWTVDTSFAKAGDVTIVNGGDIAKEAGLVPPGAATPEAAPGTTPTPAPTPVPPAAPAGPQYQYNPQSVTWEPNCGLVQIKVRIQQPDGSGINDVRVMVAAAAGGWATASVATGQEGRDIGWTNVVLRTDPADEPWNVWVIDGAGNQASPIITVVTDTKDCVPTGTGHQVATVTFVNAPAVSQPAQPSQPSQPAPVPPAVTAPYPFVSGFSSWEPNCGLAAVKIKAIDQAGNALNGVIFHIESGDGTWSATSRETGSSGYDDGMTDFTLRQEPVAETWRVWAVDPKGFRLSGTVFVPTDTGPCLPGEEGHQVASLQFQKVGPIVTPTPVYPYSQAGISWAANCSLTQLNFRIRDKAGNPIDGLRVHVETDGVTWSVDSLPTGSTGQGAGITNIWLDGSAFAIRLNVFVEDKDGNPMSNAVAVDTSDHDCSGAGHQVATIDFVRNN